MAEQRAWIRARYVDVARGLNIHVCTPGLGLSFTRTYSRSQAIQQGFALLDSAIDLLNEH